MWWRQHDFNAQEEFTPRNITPPILNHVLSSTALTVVGNHSGGETESRELGQSPEAQEDPAMEHKLDQRATFGIS